MTDPIFATRRQRLIETIGDGIAIIPTAVECVRNRDAHYPYRFDSYFWYLSGFAEPEAVIVLIGGKTPRTLLFCRDKDPEREIWNGYRHGPVAARERFGFDEAFSFGEFEQRLPDLVADRDALWFAFGQDASWDLRITAAINTVRAQGRSGRRAPSSIRDLRAPLDGMRRRKDTYELALMRRAAVIASEGHRRAMRACRPGLFEYALEAELAYEFRRQGAAGHAYSPIVAGGANACVLHYVENDRPLDDGALVLIDAGCELDGYASDITRTFPVSGKFSGAQRDAYEIVLAAQSAAVGAIAPGRSFDAYHQAALRVLVQGMVDLKLLDGNVDGLIESDAYKPYYMHRTGHWLGLDVHDAGEYKDIKDSADGEARWAVLEPGMVLTVEPGLYVRPAAGIPDRLYNIGIRIEDDVIVTEQGGDVYTDAPRTIADIEDIMRGA